MAPVGPKLLSETEQHVKELEDLEDYYFGADKEAKMKELADRIDASVKSFLVKPGAQPLRALALSLQGRAISFLAGQERAAESLLAKAIKLDPQLLSAWNALGEVYWNMGDFKKSRECFDKAIEMCGENSVSLRNLSMVLRGLESGASPDDDAAAIRKAENYATALEKAKAAVALDANDAQNWETLGNAYMGDFFVNAKRPDEMNRALIAYGKAEAAFQKMGKSSPSLQLNRGNAAKYMEDYDVALRSFQKAHEIGAAGAVEEQQKIMDLVQRLVGYAERKGDLNAKRQAELAADIPRGSAHRTLRELRAGENAAAPVEAKAVLIIDRLDEMPVIVVCCDSLGDFFALSLYNAQRSKVADAIVPMKSMLRIYQPRFRQISVSNRAKKWSYPCVRVAHPGDVTVAGKGSLGAAAVASVFSSGTARIEARQETCAEETTKPLETQSKKEKKARQETCAEETTKPLEVPKWIEEEDAKMRKKLAKAKSKGKAKTKGKEVKQEAVLESKEDEEEEEELQEEVLESSEEEEEEEDQELQEDAELEDSGAEAETDASGEKPTEQENLKSKLNESETPQRIRWGDLVADDSDGDSWVE